jgi:hypothetical protein
MSEYLFLRLSHTRSLARSLARSRSRTPLSLSLLYAQMSRVEIPSSIEMPSRDPETQPPPLLAVNLADVGRGGGNGEKGRGKDLERARSPRGVAVQGALWT